MVLIDCKFVINRIIVLIFSILIHVSSTSCHLYCFKCSFFPNSGICFLLVKYFEPIWGLLLSLFFNAYGLALIYPLNSISFVIFMHLPRIKLASNWMILHLVKLKKLFGTKQKTFYCKKFWGDIIVLSKDLTSYRKESRLKIRVME